MFGSGVTRTPPTLKLSHPADKHWAAPPDGFSLGDWWLGRTSNPSFSQLYNFQIESASAHGKYPDLPSDVKVDPRHPPTIDLASFNSPDHKDTNISTIFAYDVPHANDPCVYDFRATGTEVEHRNTFETLSWGYDPENGCAKWLLFYETAVVSSGQPTDLSIVSRTKKGPSSETYKQIIAAVKALKVPEVTTLADQMYLMPTDGRRNGLKSVPCDDACKKNAVPASANRS